jgi:lysophospholipase L1-like esterase
MRRLLLPGLLALASCVLAAEIAARVDDWYKYSADPLDTYNREQLVAPDETEVRGMPYGRFEKWRLNNLGFRGPDIGEKHPGRPRVVAIGSSETFGLYEEEGKEWPAQLREALKTQGVDAEVINTAFYGFGLQRNVDQFERRVLTLEPDVAILYLDPYSGHYLKGIDAIRRPSIDHWGTDLRISRKLWSLLQGLIPRPVYKAYLKRLVQRERRQHQLEVLDRVPPVVYERIRADLDRLAGLAKRHGVRLILTSHIRRTDELALLMAQRDRAVLTFEAIIDAHEQVNALFADAAAAHGLPFVDLDAAIPATPALVADASHFSNEGARMMAEHLLPAVLRELPSRSVSVRRL